MQQAQMWNEAKKETGRSTTEISRYTETTGEQYDEIGKSVIGSNIHDIEM